MSYEASDAECVLGLLRLRTRTDIVAQRERIAAWCEEHDHPVDRYIAFSDPSKLIDVLDKGDTLVMTSYKQISRDPNELLRFARHCNERDLIVD